MYSLHDKKIHFGYDSHSIEISSRDETEATKNSEENSDKAEAIKPTDFYSGTMQCNHVEKVIQGRCSLDSSFQIQQFSSSALCQVTRILVIIARMLRAEALM